MRGPAARTPRARKTGTGLDAPCGSRRESSSTRASSIASSGQLSVGFFDAKQRLGRHAPGEELAGVAAELLEPGRGQTSSHGLFVPPEFREEMRHLRKDSVKGDARDAPPGPARPILLQPEEQDGPVVFPGELRGRDAEHSPMPAGLAFDQDGRFA